MMGVQAVDVLCEEDETSKVIVARNGRFEAMDMEEALTMERTLDEEMYSACYRITTSFHRSKR